MKLADFVRDLADHLALGTELPYEDIFLRLDLARERVAEMEAFYAEEELPIAGLMTESLQLFDSAFARLLAGEELALAVVEAEEADDLLELVEYDIACAQELQDEHQLA